MRRAGGRGVFRTWATWANSGQIRAGPPKIRGARRPWIKNWEKGRKEEKGKRDEKEKKREKKKKEIHVLLVFMQLL